MIRNNMRKYSISAMRDVLDIPRNTFYYEPLEKPCEEELVEPIKAILKASRNTYGTRKIKEEFKKLTLIVSRKYIGRIMREQGSVSNYAVAQFKPAKPKIYGKPVKNELNREFDGQEE